MQFFGDVSLYSVLSFGHSTHFPVLPPLCLVLSHFQILHIPSSACSLPLRLLYWVDSHSSVKILLKCHFLHEAIAEPFSNAISLFSPLCSDLQCITLLSDGLFTQFSNALWTPRNKAQFILFILVFYVSLRPSTVASTKYMLNEHLLHERLDSQGQTTEAKGGSVDFSLKAWKYL